MFDKKKLNFWRLAVIFMGVIVISLSSLWLSPQGTKATMMNVSMGNMAKDMHLSNITIYDLVDNPETETETETQTDKTDSTEHHSEPSDTKSMGIITTLIIFSLLPLLIGGSIILAIVWIK
ncbi:MAG: hypothetical protein K0S01_556 [Herbinix sp.]|jgi:hypothetical protein|nr:hypothetical protein [Herbinix sp.]